MNLSSNWIWLQIGFIVFFISTNNDSFSVELSPGKISDIYFPQEDFPKTLYSMFNETEAAPCLRVRLPDDYDPSVNYPLLLYVPGFHGGEKGNIDNAIKIGGTLGWITASLPLFKQDIDRDEVAEGVIISFQDYPILSDAYKKMIGKLFDLIPNINREKSAMVGFSNGAIAIAILVSNHDEFILTHFKNFCLVDQGMFHLTDLHKQFARDCRYLFLVGDKEDFGRDERIRQSKLLQDSWSLLSVNLKYHILKDTGHEFQDWHMALVGKWARNESFQEINAN